MTTAEIDTLSRTFSALADPTRRALLARLADGEASVGDLAEPFAMSRPAISKHLKVLEQAGLITRGQRAQWRPRQLDATPMRDAAAWLHGYEQFWSDRLDRMGDYVEQLHRGQAGTSANVTHPATTEEPT